MVRFARVILAGAVLLASTAALVSVRAQQAAATHRVVPANAEAWGPAPPTLPRGAQAAVLYGDPAKEGLFVMRLKAPKGYALAPHVHSGPEIVTVISGAVRLGIGSDRRAATTRPLDAGSFYSTEAGTPHFLIIDSDAVLQVNSKGPWGIEYLNPGDDPRNGK
jgi:quercetin dioxygenase-like cupin family protein